MLVRSKTNPKLALSLNNKFDEQLQTSLGKYKKLIQSIKKNGNISRTIRCNSLCVDTDTKNKTLDVPKKENIQKLPKIKKHKVNIYDMLINTKFQFLEENKKNLSRMFEYQHNIAQPAYKFQDPSKVEEVQHLQSNFHANKQTKAKKITMRTRVIKIIKKLKQLCLSPTEINTYKVFGTEPYDKKHSIEFFTAAKENSVENLRRLLYIDKYLVYAFDQTYKTALHWATCKGNYAAMKFLLENHSDVDSKDILNKTSLHIACVMNDIVGVQVLV